MTPEAEKIRKAFLDRGFNLVDRFGWFEAAGEVVRSAVAAQKEKDAVVVGVMRRTAVGSGMHEVASQLSLLEDKIRYE